ncbi:hypothetical protein ABEB36_002058 [Hypothenemus hampei]|uniref:Ribosome-binding protein 1 n=1 Tax=Hypothenemus hampei TaxID=57062 RepID=A0ABD1F4T2_HYPHA
MDITTPLIFLSIFIFACMSLFLVYKYGIKKKSYEEVLAEQRKQTSALLGAKPKLKEKKLNKKAAKKLNREKTNENVTPDHDITEVDVLSDEISDNKEKEVKSKGDSKGKNQRKPSKVHVEFKEPEKVPVVEKEVKEVFQTKDAIHKSEVAKEDKKTGKKSKQTKQQDDKKTIVNIDTKPVEKEKPKSSGEKDRSKIVVDKEKPKTLEKSNEEKSSDTEKEKPEEEKPLAVKSATSLQVAPLNSAKEKKKKKNDAISKQQIIAERDQLIHSIRNAELSRTEVQLLIDLLLNKQLEAPIIDDWSEGKSDPVQKLKKQLADKEKQLQDEQEALAGVQAKLKEVRIEQSNERTQLQQKLKRAEESKIDIVAAHNRLQQKILELEDLLNKERSNYQIVLNDYKALQLQSKQLESTLISYQETEIVIHNLKAENLHLTKECQLLTQQMQEQDRNYQSLVQQLQNIEMNHSYALSAHQEEVRKMAENHHIEEQKFKEIIEHLNVEIQKLQEKNHAQLNGSSDAHKEHEMEILNLTNELSSVKSELKSVNQTFVEIKQQYQDQLTVSQEKYNQLKIELDEQQNKNNELRKKNWKVVEALNAAESRNKSAIKQENVNEIMSDLKAKEQNAQKEFLQRLFPELSSLQSLATKENWLNEYELAIRDHITQLQSNPATLETSEKSPELIKLQNEVLKYQKIIDETEGILKQLESHIDKEERSWRSQLNQKEAEIEELKTQNIFQANNGEACPNTPDSNGIQFAYKCIEKSLPVIIAELELKVEQLESELTAEKAEKLKLLEERQRLTNGPEVKIIHTDSTATVEKLSEEVDRLRELLNKREQNENSEDGIYQNGATS